MVKTAFSLGIFDFSWYGIIVALAIIAAYLVNWWQSRLYNVDTDKLFDLTLYTIPVGLLSARFYYIAVNWPLYAANLDEIPRIWHGGLAIHGALIGVIVTIWVFARLQKTRGASFWRLADIVAPGLILGQAIGQWGNFINQDAFGYPTDAPWGIYIDYVYRPLGYEQFDFFHPAFLYEFIWDLLVFLFLVVLSWQLIKKKVRTGPGMVFLAYIILYSCGRFVIEGFRLDSEMIGNFRLAQIVSAVSIVWAGLILVRCKNKFNTGA